jgi:pilus assembly protein CpaE
MTTRILPAAGDPDAARVLSTLLSQLPDTEPAAPVTDSTALLDTLARLAGESLDELPEVVLVHERIGPAPALELIREVALRFPAVGVVLITADTSPMLFTAAMDAGARGLVGLPLGYEELAARVQGAATWAVGVRRHLGVGTETVPGPGGTVVTVTGAKGGVGATLTAVQLALAARASGRSVALVDMDLQAGDVASYLDVQFRRSIADLAGISDISPRVLQDAVFAHASGLALLLAPGEGERGEEVNDRTVRQILSALRNRYEVVIVDCGTQMNSANAAAIEMGDMALLVTTPDVIAVRGAKRIVRLWDRLQIRKAEETVTVVNRYTRSTEIQPPLVERITGTRVARVAIPANFKELQAAVDSGRMQDLDSRSTVKQALLGLAAELGLVKAQEGGTGGSGRWGRLGGDRGAGGFLRRARGGDQGDQGDRGDRGDQADGADRGALTVEFAGMLPVILAVVAILWQCVLYGYTWSLAGNAADEGARAGAVGGDCAAAAQEHLPSAWPVNELTCGGEGMYTASVELQVPLFLPGFDAGWTVEGMAGVPREDPAP